MLSFIFVYEKNSLILRQNNINRELFFQGLVLWDCLAMASGIEECKITCWYLAPPLAEPLDEGHFDSVPVPKISPTRTFARKVTSKGLRLGSLTKTWRLHMKSQKLKFFKEVHEDYETVQTLDKCTQCLWLILWSWHSFGLVQNLTFHPSLFPHLV